MGLTPILLYEVCPQVDSRSHQSFSTFILHDTCLNLTVYNFFTVSSLIVQIIHRLSLQLDCKLLCLMFTYSVGAHYMSIIIHLLIGQINSNTSLGKPHLICFSSLNIILSQKLFFILEHSTEIFHIDYFLQENHVVLKMPKSIMRSSLNYSYFRNVLIFFFFAINLLF